MVSREELHCYCQSALSKSDNGMLEALWIVTTVLEISETDLFLHGDIEAPQQSVDKCKEIVNGRLAGTPLYYLLGECEFYGLKFKVGEGALIPRQDTEILVDTALQILADLPNASVVDLCAGCGTISIPIALTADCTVKAVEKYDTAFSYLKQNIELHNVQNIEPILGDALSFISDIKYDMICSNPPYIAYSEKDDLQKEVLCEPETALFADEDGLYFYRVFLENFSKCPPRNLLFEIGNTQGDRVSQMMIQNGYKNVRVIKDFGGNDRVVVGTH